MTAPDHSSRRSALRTLAVVATVAVVCGALVTGTAVALRPRILSNIKAAQQARMAAMLDAIPGLAEVLGDSGASALEPVLVDLASGERAAGDPLSFDPVAAAADPATGRALTADEDIAGLGRIATSGVAYIVRDGDGALMLAILPIAVRGYASVIRGYLALEQDLTTVAALNIIEQGETPGLGARIQTPEWQALWPGRSVARPDGTLGVTIVRQGSSSAPYEVDGLTGATRSSTAVGAGVTFWLGDAGYGPFLSRLAATEASR